MRSSIVPRTGAAALATVGEERQDALFDRRELLELANALLEASDRVANRRLRQRERLPDLAQVDCDVVQGTQGRDRHNTNALASKDAGRIATLVPATNDDFGTSRQQGLRSKGLEALDIAALEEARVEAIRVLASEARQRHHARKCSEPSEVVDGARTAGDDALARPALAVDLSFAGAHEERRAAADLHQGSKIHQAIPFHEDGPLPVVEAPMDRGFLALGATIGTDHSGGPAPVSHRTCPRSKGRARARAAESTRPRIPSAARSATIRSSPSDLLGHRDAALQPLTRDE